ncbi:MAG: hypothetical protein U9N39_01495 [Campylobacterota bacterium]|nr:hypothetical protein [Campylobacterota bacterium]
MKKIGIGVDYSNICKDYNTAYLDRDNTDPATSKCMKQVLAWSHEFLSEFLMSFEYKLHNLSSSTLVKVEDVASKRFLFYSLEKEITLQSFVLFSDYKYYDNSSAWGIEENDGVLVQNDEDGGALYFFCNEGSPQHHWITQKLQEFSLDEVPFPAH